MALTIHPDAAKNIDAKANTIKQAVQTGSFKPKKVAGWEPDVHATHLDAKDIKGPVRMSVGGEHPFVASIEMGTSQVIQGTSAQDFSRLTLSLHRAFQPANAVSLDATESILQQWLFDTHADEFPSEYCRLRLAQQIRRFRVWVPIANLHVQTPFSVGPVGIQTITSDLLKNWVSRKTRQDDAPDIREQTNKRFEDLDKKLRGAAAGVVEIEAEPIAARVFALEQVEDALSLLRLFAGPAIIPRLRSYCAPRGQENMATYHVILESNDNQFHSEARGLLDRDSNPWRISTQEIAELNAAGLARLGSILHESTRSDFQTRVMAALRLYSDSTRERQIASRLVLIFAALESLFLKNANEPITQNLSERLAILSMDTPDDRVSVVQLTRRVYAQRSKFVHHSEHIELNDDLEQFVGIAWHGLMTIIANIDTFKTLGQFIEHLDRLKMSGRSFVSNSNS
ncbi:MAG: hypothetical protein KDA16_00885 [Phycisphaerales bacterium]|nr:hypothetical protein [Phycisphaerales bacterium]